MNLSDEMGRSRTLLTQRLSNQRLSRRAASPREVVRQLGAVQAQDYRAAVQAIAMRCAGTILQVEQAIVRREIVRSWPMRGTLHFIPAEDSFWMHSLLTPRILTGAARRMTGLGLDVETFRKAHRILEKTLRAGEPMTRKHLLSSIAESGIPTDRLRGTHLLWEAAQQGLICFGPRQEKQHTFVWAEAWISRPAKPDPDEALAKLTRRYFQGHGPATAEDFAWWSGLTLREARRGTDLLKGEISGWKSGERIYFRSETKKPPRRPAFILLPAFDEYVLGYKHRAEVLPDSAKRQYTTANGIFAPVVLIDGVAKGTWKISDEKVLINWFSSRPELLPKDSEWIAPRLVS